jgi:hypothetical protein
MRHTLPIVLTLAAFTAAGFSGTASANNILNPWTAPLTANPPTKPPKANTNQNPPAAQTNQNSSATQTKSAPSTHANQNPSGAAQTTAPNSSLTQTSSNPGNQIKPAADPKKDIVNQTQDIKKYEGYIAELHQMKSDVIKLTKSLRNGATFGRTICDSNGCTRTYTTDTFGGPRVTIKILVDAKGNALPGEFDKMVNAQATAIDKAIAADTQRIASAKKQIDADYSVLPGPSNGGLDNHRRGSTVLHQD